MFNEKQYSLYVGDLALRDLAKTYGTPLYVYATEEIKAQYNKLIKAMKSTLPTHRQPMLCYAAKANDHVAVLSYIRSLGACVEIISEGELRRALKAGFKPEQIVATGVGKSITEITALLDAGIHQINAESLEELARIQNVAASLNVTADVVLRLNPNVSGGTMMSFTHRA